MLGQPVCCGLQGKFVIIKALKLVITVGKLHLILQTKARLTSHKTKTQMSRDATAKVQICSSETFLRLYVFVQTQTRTLWVTDWVREPKLEKTSHLTSKIDIRQMNIEWPRHQVAQKYKDRNEKNLFFFYLKKEM